MTNQQIDPVLAEYLAECEELTQRVSNHLRQVEKGQWSAETIDSIYRDIHTIKGSAQLFGYMVIGEIGHAMETSLDPVRRLRLAPTPAHLEALFRCLDVIEQAASAVRSGKEDSLSGVAAPVVQLLLQASSAGNGELSLAKEMAPLESSPRAVQLAVAAVEIARSPSPSPPAPPAAPANPSPAPGQATNAPAEASKAGGEPESSSIRVPVALLDKLMILMGEMVLVRNQVLQYANRNDDLEFLNLSQRLDVVTSEIQGEIMKTRMQPIGNVLSKFHRVVRDLSRDLGKKIDLQLSGTETELDKTLLEAVKDPIMHIVRNSCDHGMETPEERKAAGKAETGAIAVRSFHEGGQVIVEISDDGRGLNREKITAKAVEKGILTPERAAALSEREAQALIFAPGFSTAAQVTNVSGRGVGMDVVKSNIEGIGGMVDLASRYGHGTTIRLKIPLTLAIVPAMIVRCREERFAIPQVKLVELVRVEKNVGTNQIELLQGKPIYRLRGNLLPLLYLEEILGMPENPARPQAEVSNIVVLNAEGKLFGLIVDEVQDTAEVVVKPLSSFLKALSVYSGATVLGDGSVALILDVMGIAQQQKLLTESSGKSAKAEGAETGPRSSELQEFLLFRVASPTKHAIPLNLVHRLEEISRSSLEVSGAQRVIRYRNSVLPILSLNEILGFAAKTPGITPSETLSIIVLHKSGRYYGVEVDEILDVLNTAESMDDGLCDRAGLLGNLVTPEEIIVVVDALQILDSFAKKHNPGIPVAAVPKLAKRDLKILYAEDTAFFRKHVAAVLQRAGFQVTLANDGAEALRMLDEAQASDFDLILSDIEMPNLNGLELAKAIRKHARWAPVPLLALTTKYNGEHAEEGRRAGFDAYLEKLNPEILLKAIGEAMASHSARRSA